MTAKELIEVLKEADEDAQVFFCDSTLFPHSCLKAEVGEYNGKKNGKVVVQ